MHTAIVKWTPGPVNPDLPGESIHIWRFPLSVNSELEARFLATLSADETAKLTKTHLPALRNRQIAARGYLRAILTRYLHLKSPGDIEFSYGTHGKPRLSAELNPKLHFNMTHVDQMGMVAVTQAGPVGLDLEEVPRHGNWPAVARRTLSIKEYRALLELPSALQQPAFATTWTRKEAYTKALGDGFQYGFRNFSVSVDPDAPPRLLEDTKNSAAPNDWTLESIGLSNDLTGTLAYRGSVLPKQYWSIDGL